MMLICKDKTFIQKYGKGTPGKSAISKIEEWENNKAKTYPKNGLW
jgi:hypothetical protein